MSFDEIFDLTAGVYFNFYNIIIEKFKLQVNIGADFSLVHLHDAAFVEVLHNLLDCVDHFPRLRILGG